MFLPQSQSSEIGSQTYVFAFAALLSVFLLFVGGIVLVALHYRSRNLRLKTIQDALASNGLDAETKRMLGEALTANSRRIDAMGRWIVDVFRNWGRTIFFVVGWLTFVVSGLCLVGMIAMGGARTSEIQMAVFATAVGFGLVSLPVAIGELRKGQPGTEQR